MSHFLNVNAIVTYAKIETKHYETGSITQFKALFFFDKDAVEEINAYLEPTSKSNKNRTYHLKPVSRESFPFLSDKYTHQMNIGSRLDWISFVNIYGQDVEPKDIGSGDAVRICVTPKESKAQTGNEKFLGAYLKSIAIIRPKVENTRGVDKAKVQMLEELKDIEASFSVEEHVPL